MNLNKEPCRIRPTGWLPYFILFFWFCAYSTLEFFPYASWDFIHDYYLPGRTPTDQFSPLLWKQLQFTDWLIPGEYNARSCAKLFALFWHLILLCAAVLIAKKIIHSGQSPFPFVIALVILINPLWIEFWTITADLAVASYTALALASVYYLKEDGSSWKKGLFCTALIFLIISHRQNAILAAPALTAYTAYNLFPANKRSVWRVTLAAVLSCGVLFALVHHVHYGTLNAKKVNAQVVMMQSDIYCTDVLLGETPCKNVSERLNCGLFGQNSNQDFQDSIHARPLLQEQGIIVSEDAPHVDKINIAHYPVWKDEWIRNILLRPKEFLTVRAILTCQFFSQGKCPGLLRSYVSKHYPHAKIRTFPPTAPPCNNLAKSIAYRLKCEVIAYILRDIAVIAYLLSIPVLFVVFMFHRRNAVLSPILRLSIGAYGVSVLYTLSMIPFVPTPDSRFLTTSLITWSISLAALFTYFCDRRRSANSITGMKAH